MLNKQVGAADNGWSFKEANNSSPEGTNTLRNKQVYCQLVVPTCDSQKCFYMFRLLSINFHRKQKIFKHSKATVHIRTQQSMIVCRTHVECSYVRCVHSGAHVGCSYVGVCTLEHTWNDRMSECVLWSTRGMFVCRSVYSGAHVGCLYYGVCILEHKWNVRMSECVLWSTRGMFVCRYVTHNIMNYIYSYTI